MQIIHREGHRFLLKTLAIAIAIVFAGFKCFESCFVQYSILGVTIFFWLIFLQFFRNPSFQKVTGDKFIVAPADGEVVVIENVQETEYFKGERTQISIFMTPLNVHVNRNPVGGVVKYFKYHEGKYMVASHPKSSTENERTTTVVENSNGVEILFRQVAGALARRICWYVKEGDQVGQSEEMGFIKFGSRVDIYVPTSTKINVKLGEKTKGGRTVIAELA
jgi:phosphatidylserine decarboxylase